MDFDRINTALMESLFTLTEAAAALVPNLIGAVVLLVLGWLLARLLRASLRRVLDTVLGRLGSRAAQGTTVAQAGTQATLSAIVSGGAYWLILAVFVLAAIRLLDLPVLNQILAAVGGYLPHLVAAGVILIGGYLASELARGAIVVAARSAEVAYGDALGRAVQSAIMLLAVVVGVDELGVDTTILIIAAAVLLAATFGGAAIAFGLGATTAVGNLLASHFVQRAYQAGQRVRIGEIEGRILEITETAVIMETDGGRLHVPARRFSEEASLLVTEEA